MSDQPLTRAIIASVLTEFHRDVVRPDIQHIVGQEVGTLRREMFDHFDGVHHQLERLDHESVAIKPGLQRVEERLEEMIAVEEKARVERLHEDVRRLEQRIKPSAKG